MGTSANAATPSYTQSLHSTGRIVKAIVAALVLAAVIVLVAVQLGPVGLAAALVVGLVVAWFVLYQWQLMRGLSAARQALRVAPSFSAAGVEGNSHWWLGRAVLVAAGPSEVVAARMNFTRVQILWRSPRKRIELKELLPARRSSQWTIQAEGHALTLRTSRGEADEAVRVFGGAAEPLWTAASTGRGRNEKRRSCPKPLPPKPGLPDGDGGDHPLGPMVVQWAVELVRARR